MGLKAAEAFLILLISEILGSKSPLHRLRS
jgi:hypothetical protein